MTSCRGAFRLLNRSESEAVFVRDFRRFRNWIPQVKTKIMIAGSDPESSEPAIIMFCNVHIGFIQQVYKVEFARRAGGQVVTSVICIRSRPFNLGMIATGNH